MATTGHLVSPFTRPQGDPAWNTGDKALDLYWSMMFWAKPTIDMVEALADGDEARFRSAGRRLGNPKSVGWAMADVLIQAMLPAALSDVEDAVGDEWGDELTNEAADRIAAVWGDEFDPDALRQIYTAVADPAHHKVADGSATTAITRRAACLAGLVAGSYPAEIWQLALDSVEKLTITTEDGTVLKVGRGFYFDDDDTSGPEGSDGQGRSAA